MWLLETRDFLFPAQSTPSSRESADQSTNDAAEQDDAPEQDDAAEQYDAAGEFVVMNAFVYSLEIGRYYIKK